MLTDKQIKEIICDSEIRNLVHWVIDITDEPEVVGRVGYLSILPPEHLRNMAHAFVCRRLYKGERKQRKATRRFVRIMNRNYPEVLESAYKEAILTMNWP